MRVARLLPLAAVALLWAPTAIALDAFPGHETFGATEARLLVRLPHGGALRVATDPPLEVALVTPGETPERWERAPVDATVTAGRPESSWHGLPGTVEVVLRRADARQEVRVELEDGGGVGAEYVWPSTAAPLAGTLRIDAPSGPLVAVSAALVAASFKRLRGERGGVCASR
jgi:hypothetical protein